MTTPILPAVNTNDEVIDWKDNSKHLGEVLARNPGTDLSQPFYIRGAVDVEGKHVGIIHNVGHLGE